MIQNLEGKRKIIDKLDHIKNVHGIKKKKERRKTNNKVG